MFLGWAQSVRMKIVPAWTCTWPGQGQQTTIRSPILMMLNKNPEPYYFYMHVYIIYTYNIVIIEVRDFPHGIFGSCTRYPRGLTRWAELLGRRRRRRRRRQLVLPGGYRPPDPPPCLISKEQVLAQMV